MPKHGINCSAPELLATFNDFRRLARLTETEALAYILDAAEVGQWMGWDEPDEAMLAELDARVDRFRRIPRRPGGIGGVVPEAKAPSRKRS